MGYASRYVVVESEPATLQERGGDRFSKVVRFGDSVRTQGAYLLMFRINPTANFEGTLAISVRRFLQRDSPAAPARPFPTSPQPEAPVVHRDYRFNAGGAGRTFHTVIPGVADAEHLMIELRVPPRDPHQDERPGIGSITVDDVVLWFQVDA
jgi:hypothetical protein